MATYTFYYQHGYSWRRVLPVLVLYVLAFIALLVIFVPSDVSPGNRFLAVIVAAFIYDFTNSLFAHAKHKASLIGY